MTTKEKKLQNPIVARAWYRDFALFSVFVLLAFLRLWKLTDIGVQHDAALYAVRADGWLDFLVGAGQTSPIVWFGHIPWWANLSFHDHPPLVFVIEHFFIRVFGENTWAVLLPGALAGIGTLLVLYVFLREFKTRAVALTGMVMAGVSSYAVWVSRSGYLEGVEIFFMTVSLYTFYSFLQTRKTRTLLVWSVATAFALLSKYTAIFLLPAYAIFVLWRERWLLRERRFWLSILLFLALLSPVTIYNYEVYQARGHFDAAISSMVGMHPTDYSVISSRGVNTNLGNNFRSVYDSVMANGSLPFLITELLALVLGSYFALKNRDRLWQYILFTLGWLILLFLFAGGQPRFMTLVVPFFAANLAFTINAISVQWLKPGLVRRGLATILGIILLLEMGYAINTSILRWPVGQAGVTYSTTRFFDNGFAELDKYLSDTVFNPLPPRRTVRDFSQIVTTGIHGGQVVIFDSRADWFSTMWHVNRYDFYYDTPIIHFTDFVSLADQEGGAFGYLQNAGVKNFWFIETADGGVVGGHGNEEYEASLGVVRAMITRGGIAPEKEIKNAAGQTVFRIYHFATKESST